MKKIIFALIIMSSTFQAISAENNDHLGYSSNLSYKEFKILYYSDNEKDRNYAIQYFNIFFNAMLSYHSMLILDKKELLACPNNIELMDLRLISVSMRQIEEMLTEQHAQSIADYYPFNTVYMKFLQSQYPCVKKDSTTQAIQ